MKDRYFIPVSNKRFRIAVNKISGIMKEISYRYIFRKRNKFKKVKMDAEHSKEIKRYFKQYGFKNVDTYSHGYYEHYSGVKSTKYIPNYIYFRYIEPALNKLEFASAYADKNTYHQFSNMIKLPKTIIASTNGKFYDGFRNQMDKEKAKKILSEYPLKIIVKPSIDSGAGRNIFVFDSGALAEEAFDSFGKNFIVQEFMKQNSELSRLFPSAVSTIRLLTLQLGDEVHCLGTHLRIGNNEAQFIDLASEGLYCGIKDDGNLHDIAYGRGRVIFSEHPYTKESFSTIKLPNFQDAIDKVKAMHLQLPYFQIVSWDLGLDESDEYFLIELNLMHQGSNVFQVMYGPLFGQHTEKVLDQVFERGTENAS